MITGFDVLLNQCILMDQKLPDIGKHILLYSFANQ